MLCPVCDRVMLSTGGVFACGRVLSVYCARCAEKTNRLSAAAIDKRHSEAARRIYADRNLYPNKIFKSQDLATLAYGLLADGDISIEARGRFFSGGEGQV